MSKKTVVEAPLGGTILDLKVNVGDQVSANDTLFVLEAMKMENEIDSEVSGIVTEINIKTGDIIEANQTIMTIEEK